MLKKIQGKRKVRKNMILKKKEFFLLIFLIFLQSCSGGRIGNFLESSFNDLEKISQEEDIQSRFINKNIVGESINSKLNKITKYLKKNKCDYIFISAPENVAWTLNIRGGDGPNSPIPNSRLIVSKSKKIILISNPKKCNRIMFFLYFNFISKVFFNTFDFIVF